MNKILKAHLTLILVNVVYAANYLVAKGIMPDYIGPSGFIVFRVTGAVILFFIIKTRVKETIDKKDWIKLALAGLFGVAINQLLFFNGLNLTSPINASIIMTSNPIMVLIISHLLIRERITKSKLLGIIIGGAGAVLLLISTKGQDQGHASFWGDLMVFINAMSYGIYLVIAKPLLKKYSPLTVITWVFFFGWLIVTPIGFNQAIEVDWAVMPMSIIWGVVYVIIFTTFLVYLLNIQALKIVSPSVASTYIYLQPVLAGLFAWLYDYFTNNEQGYSQDITWFKVFTTLMIFFGVYLVGRSASAKTN
ncbi:MAG TPA: EamA/RhaT family transporter [Bacteroidetes bacterium]|nr:MAG: EamA/RhaT family transporter [Bacteroidota bacterium]HHE65158.1 EamA/RhaT family transporter [Bacteroidota bacterium]